MTLADLMVASSRMAVSAELEHVTSGALMGIAERLDIVRPCPLSSGDLGRIRLACQIIIDTIDEGRAPGLVVIDGGRS